MKWTLENRRTGQSFCLGEVELIDALLKLAPKTPDLAIFARHANYPQLARKFARMKATLRQAHGATDTDQQAS